jgi:L-asparaginase II
MPNAIEPGSPGLGIAFKVMDGDLDNRSRPVIAIEVLRQMGAISASECAALKDYDSRPIYNFRHLRVGEYRSAFTLNKWH